MSRVVLVTGSSAGLGKATADLLSTQGWTVIGASRRGGAGAGWAGGLVMDVDDDESVSRGVDRIITDHGRIDAIVTAAGWGLAGPVETTSIDEAKSQVETNFWGAVRVVTAALPHMRAQGGGRLVLISSIGGLIAVPFQAYYSASKFALEGWAEAMAYEIAPYNIDVTLIEPGNFRTDFTASRRENAEPPGDYEVAYRHALDVMEHDELNGAPPAQVAQLISKQLTAKRPRRRISVGKSGERVGLVAKRVLPHNLFEMAAKDALGVE